MEVAMIEIPNKMSTTEISFAASVLGVRSPNPTVEVVTTLN